MVFDRTHTIAPESPVALTQKIIAFWWQHWIGIMVLNILWFLLQIPIITGPPATAAFFAIGQRMLEGEVWDARDMWREMQRLFLPAWRWAIPYFLIAGVLLGNVALYANQVGLLWHGLRMAWAGLFLIWVAVTLLYWPFWLNQQTPSLMTSTRNGLRFCMRHPGTTLLFVILSSTFLVISTLIVLPLLFGGVGFVVLGALGVVNWSLRQ